MVDFPEAHGKEVIKPYNFEKLRDHCKTELKYEFSSPENMVLIGDTLTTDILFGNLNNMSTIWVHKHKDLC